MSRTILKKSAAATAEQIAEGNVDTSVETSLLEQVINDERKNDPAGFAAEQLRAFALTPGAKSLLDRSLDSMTKNSGNGLKDADAAAQVKQRAELIDAAGGDLSIVIDALSTSCGPLEVPGVVYSMLYNVLKNAVFIANMDYRRALDPKGDFDYTPYVGTPQGNPDHGGVGFHVDQRFEAAEMSDAPYGMDSYLDRQFNAMRALYGDAVEEFTDAIPKALEDLRLFFQLTCESFGWDPENVMPFSNTMNPNGTFDPVHDAMLALDAQEIKRQVSRKRRNDERATQLSSAAERARELARAALRR
jgi:hypothetical protein